ncbi:hypothetical protein N3K66_002126 [Trichothecium roseum]|uniref:Uncharacterized protein n=1 Tax=Trichothecium roseum TaxID=47278 RepID=A0ACC0V980_9HYPO|nr:hypothetical protein N3K66_002126 [Trichothecium roseum]
MTDNLDSIVKGASAVAPEKVKHATQTSPIQPVQGKPGDPTNNAPNAPSMIYLNMLILEASLRAQYLELRARKRHHTFFLLLLSMWICYFTYQLFFAPREDGRGVGGSIYWAVEGLQKVCFMGGIITAILVKATGIWERGIKWPRRWLVISNRGLRGFNCKAVIMRRSWYAELLSTIGFFLTYGLFSHTASSSYRYVEPSVLREVEKELQLTTDNHPTLILPHDDEERGAHEEDLAPGGDYVKLLLLPKPFSPTFRENWELYRTEYWDKENERRALLRKKVQEHDERLLKQQYGRLWWLPWRKVRTDQEKKSHAHHHHHHAQHHHRQSVTEKDRRRRNSSVRRGSTSSSRAATPVWDGDDLVMSRKPSASGEKRRSKAKSGSISSRTRRPGTESRSVTPEISSPLGREAPVVSEPEPTDRSGGKGSPPPVDK